MLTIDRPQQLAPNRMGEDFARLWASLTIDQRRYAVARVNTSTDLAASEAVSIPESTMRHWANKKDIERAVGMLIDNTLDTALDMARQAASEAMQVKLEGMRDKDEKRIRQEAATEILDRVLGKPVQRVAPTNPQGTQEYGLDTDERVVARIAQIMEAARVRKEAQAQALPPPTITVIDSTNEQDSKPLEQ